MIFIARGRKPLEKDKVLHCDCRVRLNEFEKDQLSYLAQRSEMSINSYVRKLIIDDYHRYRKQKTEEAEEQMRNFYE